MILFLFLFLACGEDEKQEPKTCFEKCENQECIDLCEFDKVCKEKVHETSYAQVVGICAPSPEQCQDTLEDFQSDGGNKLAFCNEKNCIEKMDGVPYPHCWGIWVKSE